MSATNNASWSIEGIAGDVTSGKRKAADVVAESLRRIARGNGAINAMTQVFGDEAMVRAKKIDALVEAGFAPGPLAGVPVGVKDNIVMRTGFTTCGSKMLGGYRSAFDAHVVERLEAAGAVIVGKTNLDEFAMGSSTEHSVHGPTRNPHDHDRVPGGSSGGSAAAVAAGFVPLALGSDTGGSIRQPASHCGVVGFKPTYGRVSRYGLVAYASSLDQVGAIASSVRDCALATSVICGHDPRDSTSIPQGAGDICIRLDRDIDGLVVGVPNELLGGRAEGLSAGVASALRVTIEAWERSGVRIEGVDLGEGHDAIAAYYLIATAEASSNLARFDGVRFGHRAEIGAGGSLDELYCKSRGEGFGREVRKRILLGTHVLSSGYYDAYYLRALKARRMLKERYDRVFRSGVHVVMMPASPGSAFTIGSKTSDPLAMYLEDVFTVSVNLAGLPGLTVPVGFEAVGGKKLPVGMQLIGPALGEGTVMRAGMMLEGLVGVGARKGVGI